MPDVKVTLEEKKKEKKVVELTNCKTINDVRVKIAKMNGIYAPEVELSSTTKPLTDDFKAPPKSVHGKIVKVKYDQDMRSQAIMAHAHALDEANVHKLLADAGESSDIRAQTCTHALVLYITLASSVQYSKNNPGNNGGGNLISDVVSLLLKAGARFTNVGSGGVPGSETVIHCVAAKGRKGMDDAAPAVSMIQQLLQAGADINAVDEYGNTALHELANDEDAEYVQGPTSPHLSSFHLTVAQALIDHRIDVNADTNDGSTALHLASGQGNASMVTLLLKAGADVRKGDKSGDTALHAAAAGGHVDVARGLLGPLPLEGISTMTGQAAPDRLIDVQNGDGETALHHAVEEVEVEMVKLLLESYADVGIRDEDGETALHQAAAAGHKEIVDVLLGHTHICRKDGGEGTEGRAAPPPSSSEAAAAILVRKRNEEGETALYQAAREGHKDVIEAMLLDHLHTTLGSSSVINSADNNGSLPLHVAVCNGNEPLVELLLNAQADVNAADNDGETSLLQASYSGHAAIVSLLLAHKADAGYVSTKDGASALHRAATECHPGVVTALLKHNKSSTGGTCVDVDALNKSGKTALHYAAYTGDITIARMILAEGKADVNRHNSGGYTAMQYAEAMGNEAMVNLLVKAGAQPNDVTHVTEGAPGNNGL